MKLKIKDVLVVGGAVFSMLFGAGNLIFPPYIGATAGSGWLIAALGFCIASPLLSFFGIWSYVKAGDKFEHFSAKAGKGLGVVLGSILMLILGPLLAVPRTGATAFEIGFLPAFPDLPLWVFSALYFGGVLFFTLYPGNLMDKVGEILTPLLIAVLLFIIVASIVNPIAGPMDISSGHDFFKSFLGGYQTLDSIGAILLLVIAIKAVEEKGYTRRKEKFKILMYSGFLAVSLMTLVYLGLTFMGAHGGVSDLGNMTRSNLLIHIVDHSIGSLGKYMLSLAVTLACFSTAVGLVSASAMFFYDMFNQKVSYKFLVILISAVSMVLSNLGVEYIVAISAPVLEIIYPAVIMLIFLNLMSKWIPVKLAFIFGVYTAIVVSALLLMSSNHLFDGLFFNDYLKALPFVEYNFAWLIPSLAMTIVGGVLGKKELSLKVSES